MSSKEGLERYKQEKLQKRREQRLESYYRNRNLKEKEYALSDEAVRQRQHREKQEKEQMRRVKETERKRKYRKRKREENINDQRQNEDLNMRNTFENRTEKHRALKKLKLALPKEPRQAGDNHGRILAKFELADCEKLQSSEVISSPEEIEEHKTSKALTEDLKQLLTTKLLIENEPNECYSTPVYDSISDVVNATLCEKVDGSHNLQCLKRNCSDCGVKILNFPPCELDVSDTAEFVKWEKKLIETFPVHQHRAIWQNEQFQNLVRNLPEKQCVCVHDCRKNYRCSELTEIQSAYFQKTEVSVHVTILHRHALLEYDGVDSSEDFPEIIPEQFFVISPNLVHDQYFVHQVRNYIAEYLQSISYSVETMHEFTDGCAAQYKSRHCFGDISQTSDDFGYQHFTRNFFETSHAKGPQDAAGGIIKRQADCAILPGQTQIRTAKDLYEYANSFLTQPRSHLRASRDSAKGLINISELSCFCVNCCHHMYDQCSNSIKTGGYTEWEMKREYRADAQENEENEQVSLQELVLVGQLVALYTDDDEEEYYMLKVEKSMETLRIDTTDSWGSLLPAGTPVFRVTSDTCRILDAYTADIPYGFIWKIESIKKSHNLGSSIETS
ncbi:unnamed protein product [Mytilus coruscus]|uniref:Uncharacterized protein n=1 Tax=Mytilus coruscus TaxID=42192 RepID=A0A6J8CUU8_MYTCO|nr:unnamed protein product [Mytilus coruscus]